MIVKPRLPFVKFIVRFVLLLIIALLSGRPRGLGQPSPLPDSRNFDGPAELPREYVKSSLKDTPAHGKTLAVRSNQDFTQALASVACGDVIELRAGVTFNGHPVLPAKECDDSHWIIIRSSAPDSDLPPEGDRLTPCYAGVSSLPGRPHWSCASTRNVLAKIESEHGPSISFSPGANHYRLIGLEITSTANARALVEFIGAADHVVFDRVWMHGTAQGETVRGIMLGQTRYVAIVDSFFSDFHCIARSGSCSDAQAIAGGLGDGPMGPYKIVNNFLEASGENILFGGGAATGTPADIQISQNHMFKPLTWMKGQPGYVGGKDGNPFIVKNLFELKNAQRVLFEGNILENSWGGFSQVGFAILLTPKNQSGHLCPICQITDVTIRYNSIHHVGAGLQIANALDGTGPGVGPPLDGQRYSIHDIVIDDIDGEKYNGPGEFAQVSVSPGAPVLQNVTLNHVTAFPSSHLFIIGDYLGTTPQMKNFVFTNSIVNAGLYPIWSTGGGATNCAASDSPLIAFNACFSSYTFSANAIVATPPAHPPAKWPAKNFFPEAVGAVRFVNYNGGKSGDYHLQLSSPYKGKGTDGKDLGADVDAVNSATAGVE